MTICRNHNECNAISYYKRSHQCHFFTLSDARHLHCENRNDFEFRWYRTKPVMCRCTAEGLGNGEVKCDNETRYCAWGQYCENKRDFTFGSWSEACKPVNCSCTAAGHGNGEIKCDNGEKRHCDNGREEYCKNTEDFSYGSWSAACG